MIRITLLHRAVAIASFVSASITAAGENRAALNVVFILADDLGCRDLGCYGSTFHETPAIDGLAREGIRFTNAYAACPVCSPTRASILTGRYPQRTGVTDWIGAAQPAAWNRNTPHLPAAYAEKLALEEVTLAERLKPHGYATFFGGKWHLGGEGFLPEEQGFDVNFAGGAASSPRGAGRYFPPYSLPNLSDGPPGEHLCERLATEAATFIGDHKAKPFLVYLPLYSVHTPLMTRPELEKKYEAKRATVGSPDEFGSEPPRRVRLTQGHAVYAGMVETFDNAVRTVLDALDRHGLADRTLVILTSDNGGVSTSEGWPTSNSPFRAGKGWLYEGGIRVPAIARLPGRIPAGAASDLPITSPDWLPTILAAAGLPPADGVDGASLWGAMTGKTGKPSPRPLFWHYPHYGNQGGEPGSAIRDGDWKLIEWFDDGRVELFNLIDDPGEKTDLAEREPSRTAALRKQLDSWQRDVGAVATTPNPGYDPAGPDGRAATASARTPTPAAAATQRAPNVIFILADDLGWGDLGAYGDAHGATPRLDAFAKQGTFFTNFYVNNPVCSPSRCGFFTGQYPARHRVHGHYASREMNERRGMSQWLDPEIPNVARVLKAAGYTTGHIGKWHLGAQEQESPVPERYGFDFVRAYGQHNSAWTEPAATLWSKSSRLFVDEAIRFVQENRERPFYLQLWTLLPHAPLNPTAEQMRPFERLGTTADSWSAVPYKSAETIYRASVADLDAQIGRLLDALDAAGLTEDTLVVFSSDNGPEDIHISNAGHSGVGSPGPFRGRKRSLYEGGIRVPFVVRWPGHVPAGRVDDASIVSGVDLLPTICSLAKAAIPAGHETDGVDMSAAILGTPTDRGRPLFWEWRYSITGDHIHRSPMLAVREGDWKLLCNPDGSRVELYDIRRDPGEADNVRAEHPDVAERLMKAAVAWQKTLPAGPVEPAAGRNEYPWPKPRP